jgi:hypothetical protein
MMAATDEQLIEALQQRLHTSGPQPPRKSVAAALAMARDPNLKASKACDEAGVPKGGARSRVAEYHKRIVSERLLAACTSTAAQKASTTADWKEVPPREPLRMFGPDRPSWHAKYPNLQPPRCPSCGDQCYLVGHLCGGSFCDVCKADLPWPNMYWHCGAWRSDDDSCCFDLCHSCCGASAVVDWSDGSLSYNILVPTTPDGQHELSINYDGSGETKWLQDPDGKVHRVKSRILCHSDEELAIAKALRLPCGAADGEDDPAFPLLVSKRWIEKNTPNIEMLWVEPLVVSGDGKHATRTLNAHTRDQAEGQPCHGLDDDFETVTYDYPAENENPRDIFARQRRVDRFRQREMAALRVLDGVALLEHRERKSKK